MNDQLQQAYKDYIILLERAIEQLSIWPISHGAKQVGSDADIKKGEELRALIEKLEKE